MVLTAQANTPLGPVLLTSDGEALTGLWFLGQARFPHLPDSARPAEALPLFRQTRRWLEVYFSGKAPDFTPLLRPDGTPFQQEVWALLAAIPYGQTRTYGAIAQEVARRRGTPRMSAQAVGGAVGRNPISLLIPCHRVVGRDGALTGYAGGLDRKRALLRLEGALPDLYDEDEGPPR